MAYLTPSIVLEAGGPTRFWKIYFAAPAPWNPLLMLQNGTVTNQVVGSETWPGEWPGDNTTDPAITWTGEPSLTITEYTAAPSGPTFGLPPDVVALLISRFGSVANFLRLRNLGQI
jgi:hypothetical protein